MDFILKTTDLTKTFGKKVAVDRMNMTIKPGEIYGFIGRNGAGKTTAMKTILGTLFPTYGSVELFDGEPLDSARLKIGSLIEEPGLFKDCSAYENLKRFSILFGGEDKIDRLIDLVGLSGIGQRKVAQYSLGMKQRLGIAVALLGDPQFMVLDEPINGLDPEGVKGIRDLILYLNKEKGVTFLISSHILDELSKVVTKYGVIANGVLCEEITAEDLKKRCTSRLELVVDNVELAKKILYNFVTPEEVLSKDHKIIVMTGTERAGEMNQALIQAGVMVSFFNVHTFGFEEFFIERLGK